MAIAETMLRPVRHGRRVRRGVNQVIRKSFAVVPLALALFLASSKGFTSERQDGRRLHDAHCLECHQTDVYTRSDRRVSSLPGLYKQVRFCEQQLELTWFDQEVESVAEYLNNTFYKFPE